MIDVEVGQVLAVAVGLVLVATFIGCITSFFRKDK